VNGFAGAHCGAGPALRNHSDGKRHAVSIFFLDAALAVVACGDMLPADSASKDERFHRVGTIGVSS